MPTKEQLLVAEAAKALKISVPIYRYEVKGRTVTFWLYNHKAPVKWTKRARKGTKATA